MTEPAQVPGAPPSVPPIPVPDIAGADATARGLPRRVDLTWQQRLVVDASAIADLGLRTTVASIIGAAMLPRLVGAALHPSGVAAEELDFYIDLAAEHDAQRSFPAPTTPPRVSSRPANPVATWMAHGEVRNIRFQSSFEAVNPALRDQRRSYSRNNVVHAQHWVHRDGPRPT
ncbi:MAG: alpha/beta hydrolase, partial [Mycolicibacterium cosmeticum]|nr:alpha/beta hydrolase [Mycolicibacterium cosmeticum]